MRTTNDERSLQEIAAELHVSTQRVAAILASALKKLRRELEKRNLKHDDLRPDR